MPGGGTTYEDLLKNIKWAEVELPKLVLHQTRINRLYAYVGAVVSAVTGLSVWPLLEASTEWWAKAIVTALGLIGALAISIPSIANWRDRVTQGQDLSLEAAQLMDKALQTDKGDGAKVAELDKSWDVLSNKMLRAELNIGNPPGFLKVDGRSARVGPT